MLFYWMAKLDIFVFHLTTLFFQSILRPDLNFRTISSENRGHGIIKELMEESLENRLRNKRKAFTAEKNDLVRDHFTANDFTMIPISLMLNWLRKAFLSNYSGKNTGETVK